MTTTTKYVCDFCHAEYDTEDECTACESVHIKLNKYSHMSYVPDKPYPSDIWLIADNNHMVRYTFMRDSGICPQEESNHG